jgi:hypothetical protein
VIAAELQIPLSHGIAGFTWLFVNDLSGITNSA